MPDEPGRPVARREFLRRVAWAGGISAGAAAAGLMLHDRKGPPSPSERASSFEFADYSAGGDGNRLAIARGDNRKQTLRAAINALGGIDRFVSRGDRVLLKVNAAFATPSILCATTHPDLVHELAAMCLAAGAAEVRVSDNPINDPDSCMRLSGIEQAAKAAGAKLVLPSSKQFESFTLKDASLIRNWPVLCGPLRGVNKVIGLAPLKDHHRSGASMTMKNWYGLLGGRRNIFHQDVHNVICELARMVRPTFVVLDATQTMMTNGPTGGSTSDLKQTGLMIVSTDQVAADAFGSTVLGRTLGDLPFIAKAATAGCGKADFESLKPAWV